VTTEQPLLNNPTETAPEPLIDRTDRGNFAMAITKNGNPRAETTIKVLGLNRRWLCEQRMSILADLMLHMENLRAMVVEIESASTDGEARIAQIAAHGHLKAIAAKCDDKRPHAALARKFLAQAKQVLAAV